METCHCLALQVVETDEVLATAILSGQAKAERPDFSSFRIETSEAMSRVLWQGDCPDMFRWSVACHTLQESLAAGLGVDKAGCNVGCSGHAA